MKELIHNKFHSFLVYMAALVKWMLIGALIGAAGGVIGSLFHLGVGYATTVRLSYRWVMYLMPVAGLIIVWLYKVTDTEGKGTNAIIESVHFGKNVPPLLVPVIFLATMLTHLVGGSAGREGAALQIGGGIGCKAGHILHLGEKDLPLATLCGMSGVFSALFGTPLTAALFSMEVISVGVLYYAALVPCITASMMGYLVSRLIGIAPTRFAVEIPHLNPWMMILVVILAIGGAFVSILFVRGLHHTEKAADRFLPNPWIRIVAGSAVLIVLSLLTGGDYNGAGMEVIERAMAGEADALAWIWKILFTAITIGVGFKGGEVVPSFFVGATFGCVIGNLFGMPAGFGAALGLIAVFCGAVNCPLASIMLSIELFGGQGILYFAMTCAISYLLSGYCGLYSSQTIVYSKIRAEFINQHTTL